MEYNNTYSSFQEASDANWLILKELFGNSKTFKLIKPNKINSVFDGLLTCKKDEKEIVILVEVKLRQFTAEVLKNEYANTLYLEKSKYKYLHKRAAEYNKAPGRSVKVWYLCATSDGHIFIFDITNKDYNWISNYMNSVTYSKNRKKVEKLVALLNINDALLHQHLKLKTLK